MRPFVPRACPNSRIQWQPLRSAIAFAGVVERMALWCRYFYGKFPGGLKRRSDRLFFPSSCCDKCNEWFHGECIGLDEDVGLQYDVYFCDKCRLKNPRLKCTYKTQPTVPIVRPVVAKRAPEPELDSTRAVPPVASKPRSLVTRRKSFSALVAVNEMLGEDRKREPQKPPRTRSADEAAPVKSLESKASQCNLSTNSEERTSANKGPSANIRGLKRRICCTCSCDETARPDSRYCSDECGSVTTLTRIFAVMPRLLPTWGLNCDEAKADDMMVGSLILFFSPCIYFI